jgi:hypothetical protein
VRLRLTVDHSTGAVTGVLDADAAPLDATAAPGSDDDTGETE